MKTYHIAALVVASFSGSAMAVMPTVLPEFKNEKQLATWRAEQQTSKLNSTIGETEDMAFYTGKPYLNSSGGYAFKYRNYNPELARWTSEDPSGFPDGANGSIYAPRPTSELDWAGLLAIVANSGVNGTANNSGVTMNGQWFKAATKKGNQIDVFQMTSVINQPPHPPIPGIMNDFTQNCHGYVYLPGYWIDNSQVATILADEWRVGTSIHPGSIAVYQNQSHSARVYSRDTTGNVKEVIGKNGYLGVGITGVNGTGFSNPTFYTNE